MSARGEDCGEEVGLAFKNPLGEKGVPNDSKL